MSGWSSLTAKSGALSKGRCRADGGASGWSRDARLSAALRLADGRWRLLAKVVAHSGDAVFWLAAAALALLWRTPFGREVALRLVVAVIGAGLLAGGLKRLLRRPRPAGPPDGLYPAHDRYGFPSGHAVRVAAIAAALGPLVPGWAAPLLTLWALSVALSRALLGIHYLLDVLAGLLLGGALGLVIVGIR